VARFRRNGKIRRNNSGGCMLVALMSPILVDLTQWHKLPKFGSDLSTACPPALVPGTGSPVDPRAVTVLPFPWGWSVMDVPCQ
jgi:hypothetical protein